LGVIKAARGQDLEADTHFLQGIYFDRAIIISRQFYSQFLIRRGRYQEALEILKQADHFAGGLNQPIRSSLQFVREKLNIKGGIDGR
jgi:hypothetical protein